MAAAAKEAVATKSCSFSGPTRTRRHKVRANSSEKEGATCLRRAHNFWTTAYSRAAEEEMPPELSEGD